MYLAWRFGGTFFGLAGFLLFFFLLFLGGEIEDYSQRHICLSGAQQGVQEATITEKERFAFKPSRAGVDHHRLPDSNRRIFSEQRLFLSTLFHHDCECIV
jgi:hypothetical protein